jgi:transcriptional regulator with XRE-family HTH domain
MDDSFMNKNEQSPSAEKMLVKFGLRLKQLRLAKELSQEELGMLAQLDRTYISGIERGVRNVGVVNIFRIAKALKVSPTELFILGAE